MTPPVQAPSRRGGPAGESWRALRFFGLYRLVLSGVFLALALTAALPPPFGSADRPLFAAVAALYFLLALAVLALAEKRVLPFFVQVLGQLGLDVGAITLMMYASGGIGSGVGMLLPVSVAAATLLTVGRAAFVHAAIASLAVLALEFRTGLQPGSGGGALTQAGLLGAGLFATATLVYVLARRIRVSEALARQRALDVASLERLNERIVQRIQMGIVVLDALGRVQLVNESAARLLGLAGRHTGQALEALAPGLAAQFRRWRREGGQALEAVRPVDGEADVLASFSALGEPGEGSLMFLEDAAVPRERAQQLKLASLGRLTGSIAHEIRNPLSAVRHAAQLLAESPGRDEADLRLTRIITDNSTRMNTIVENVLQLGRRARAVPERFALAPWLARFTAELCRHHELAPAEVVVEVAPAELTVRMDQSQLEQVLTNLADNALRYSRHSPRLKLLAGQGSATGRPWLEVVDNGPGIPESLLDQVFEPFFTSHGRGTGLGLYLARELCEANQATLTLAESATGGCRFRITFARGQNSEAGPEGG